MITWTSSKPNHSTTEMNLASIGDNSRRILIQEVSDSDQERRRMVERLVRATESMLMAHRRLARARESMSMAQGWCCWVTEDDGLGMRVTVFQSIEREEGHGFQNEG